MIDFAASELGRTGDASAIFATVWQVDALRTQALQECFAVIDLKDRTIAIGENDRVEGHTQISLVQSPPG